MDDLLKEFELLSLPSRVNFDSISDNCIDKYIFLKKGAVNDNFQRSLEKFDYQRVFESLKLNGFSASSFQWRKLREACLISKPLDYKFMIDGMRGIF